MAAVYTLINDVDNVSYRCCIKLNLCCMVRSIVMSVCVCYRCKTRMYLVQVILILIFKFRKKENYMVIVSVATCSRLFHDLLFHHVSSVLSE